MDQRDLDGSLLEPEDLTGDDPSISETPRARVEEANDAAPAASCQRHYSAVVHMVAADVAVSKVA